MIDPASIDLHRFIVDWHGEPDRASIPVAAELRWLPAALSQWYELSSR